MQLVSDYNRGLGFLLCTIDIFSEYAWVVPLKDKNVNMITDVSQNGFIASLL